MRAIFAVLVITGNLVAVKSTIDFTEIFSSLKRCTHNQQFLDKCIQQSIYAIKAYLFHGVSQLNISSFDPYIIDRYTINMKDIILDGTATFTNIWIYGLTDYKIQEVEYIGPTLEMRIDAFFPCIQFFADYDINGVLLNIYIKRRQHEMSIICVDVRALILLNGIRYTKSDGLQYFKVETAPVNLQIRGMKTKFHDLDDNMNRTVHLNEYLNARFKIYYPQIMKQVGYFASEIIKTIANKIYLNFPISTLLPYP